MFFTEDHLRITKVRTVDGTTPLIGEDERPVKKIIFAPNTKESRKLFEDQNTRLPTQLKMKIEQVNGYKPEAVPDSKIVEMEKRIAELEAQNKQLLNGHDKTSEVSEASEKPKKSKKIKDE